MSNDYDAEKARWSFQSSDLGWHWPWTALIVVAAFIFFVGSLFIALLRLF